MLSDTSFVSGATWLNPFRAGWMTEGSGGVTGLSESDTGFASMKGAGTVLYLTAKAMRRYSYCGPSSLDKLRNMRCGST